MATTYKVLGQTSATAAATTENLNLIKDPSFEGLTLTSSRGAAITATTIFGLTSIGLPLWNLKSDTSSADAYITNIAYSGASGTNGTKALGVSWSAGNAYSSYWLINGQGTASVGTSSMDVIDTANAAVVSPSTTYYYGCSVWVDDPDFSPEMQVHWFNSSGTVISSSSFTPNITANTWVRTTSSATSPATAAYAQIRLYFYPNANATNTEIYFDAIHLSPVSTTNTTFPNPLTGSDLTLTAPFTTRLSTNWTGTANASTTGTTYAGANVDLYTVPASTQTVASTVTISNLSTSATTYRIAVVPSGETLAKKHWIVFDAPIAANSTETYTIGMTLATGDKIKVSSDSGNVSFSAFGSEIA
jgi:hypothetical protein